ncbi:MAG TPA: PA2779 family protein [Pelomicrobium sp.]|nr:PA2779 family protein [Pelomicrobium sp.]
MKKISLKRALVKFLMLAMAAFAWPHAATAAPVGTAAVLEHESRDAQVTRVQEKLARADVERAMAALGVDPAQARERVAGLNQAEILQLERELDQLPAGGDFFAVVGIVFVVLIILELTGVTNIFTKL